MPTVPLSPDYLSRRPSYVSLSQPSDIPPGHPAVLTIRSVPTPSKLSPIQCQPGSSTDGDHHQVLSYHDRVTGLSGQSGAVSLIQRISGCRISEVLNLTTADIVPPDQLLLHALKGSTDRLIRAPELHHSLVPLIGTKHHPLFHVSYSHIYRQYINAGVIDYTPSNLRNRVTHSYRYSFIQAVHSVTKNLDTTRDIVGHKSRRSTLIYIKKGAQNG